MKPIIAVSGFGRCGSSLVMQMLAAAGVPTTGRAPSYEADEVVALDRAELRRWLGERPGHAVKFLDPHRPTMGPPSNIDYRVIWLRRERWQQARSQAKFATMFLRAGEIGISTVHDFARSYERDEPHALDAWRARTRDIAALDFECIIREPARVALTLCRYLGLVESPSRLRAMEAVVQPRSPECYQGFLEIDLLAHQMGEA